MVNNCLITNNPYGTYEIWTSPNTNPAYNYNNPLFQTVNQQLKKLCYQKILIYLLK